MRHQIQFAILGVFLFFFLLPSSPWCCGGNPWLLLQPQPVFTILADLNLPPCPSELGSGQFMTEESQQPPRSCDRPLLSHSFFLLCFLKEYLFSFKIANEKPFAKWKKIQIILVSDCGICGDQCMLQFDLTPIPFFVCEEFPAYIYQSLLWERE